MTTKIISRVVNPGQEVGTEMTKIISSYVDTCKLVRWEAVPFWTHESKSDHILLIMEFDDEKRI